MYSYSSYSSFGREIGLGVLNVFGKRGFKNSLLGDEREAFAVWKTHAGKHPNVWTSSTLTCSIQTRDSDDLDLLALGMPRERERGNASER